MHTTTRSVADAAVATDAAAGDPAQFVWPQSTPQETPTSQDQYFRILEKWSFKAASAETCLATPHTCGNLHATLASDVGP